MAIFLVNRPVPPTDPRPAADAPDAPKTAEETAEDLAKAAEKRALARQKKADLKTAGRYNQAAINMQAQIKALKDAINNEFRRSRKQNMGDISLMLGQQLDQLREAAGLRGAEFLNAASDAEKATGDVQEAGIRNLVRERADSMTAILEQGAGETDAVRAMLVNARNWSSNSSDASRTYFDTMQSINQGITDLNVDTKAALSNAQMTAEGQRESVWQDFYNRRSEAMTALGNAYGDQANTLAQAEELGRKGTGKRQTTAKKGMKKAFAQSANELGKSYVQKPLPEWIDNWEGTAQVDRRQENTNLASAPIFEGVQRAQGATLRKWSA
jgi:hypothetical protein